MQNRAASHVFSGLFFRIVFMSIPLYFINMHANDIIHTFGMEHLNSLELFMLEVTLAIGSGVGIVFLFKPSLTIKPLLGVALYYFLFHQMKSFHYTGPMQHSVKLAILTAASAACIYLATYDLLRFLMKTLFAPTLVASPSTTALWAGEFANTADKGAALENHVCAVYKALYGNAMTTGEMKKRGMIANGPGDQGADVIVNLMNGSRLAIQCKNYELPIGNGAVQEIIAAAGFYSASELAIVSPSGFTKQCRELASSDWGKLGLRLELIDADGLLELEKQMGGATIFGSDFSNSAA